MNFGITADLKSNNNTPFIAGLHKGVLISVKAEEIGQDVKYKVISFTYKDLENVRTYKKSEFAIEGNDVDFAKKLEAFNIRIKHIFETYSKFPEGGIGTTAKTFEEYLNMIELAFTKGRDGKPIFTKDISDKQSFLPVWMKLTYNKKNEIGFPYRPNFTELISESNVDKPKTLVIDKKFDIMEQKDGANNAATPPTPSALPTAFTGGGAGEEPF